MPADPLARPEEAIRRLYAYVAYRIGGGAAAEDIVSETIERALRYRSSYDASKGSPAAWLAGIATRIIADSAREPGLRSDDGPEAVAPDDVAGTVERRADLQQALAALDERSRDLIALRYGADLKAREIAALLEMETNAVEVALHRARARLRELLEDGVRAVEPSPVEQS